MSKIIGFVGFKQVGKSTAAKYLEETYGFVRHNFKDALVAEIKQNFPDLLEEILKAENYLGTEYGYDTEIYKDLSIDGLFKYKPKLMRALMVNYGTEVRRKDNKDYWVNRWQDGIINDVWKDGEEIRLSKAKLLVTDDVRFRNEAEAIKRHEGIIIHLVRPDITTGGDHKSETEQLEIEADYTIECEPGNPQKMYKELDEILKNML